VLEGYPRLTLVDKVVPGSSGTGTKSCCSVARQAFDPLAAAASGLDPRPGDGSRRQPPQRRFSSGAFACRRTAGDVPATTCANPGGNGRNPAGSVESAQDVAGFQILAGKAELQGFRSL